MWRRRALWSLLCPLLVAAACRSAQAADPWRQRDDSYYVAHLAVIGAELAATAAVQWIGGESAGRWDLQPFSPDVAVRARFSNAAAQASDRLRLVSLVVPLAAQLSSGFDRSFGNAALIYTEVQTTSWLLTTLTKEIVRRPRPYTYSLDPAVREFAAAQGSEAYVSFYSGHASATHAAAMSGSLLYAARTRELWARHFMWGGEFLLAGLTAQLRISAGRHYRTDVWAGSLMGMAAGLAIPMLHGVPLSRVRGSEVAVAAGALVLTHVGAELADFCALLKRVGACSEPLPASIEQARTTRVPGAFSDLQWSLLPTVVPGGAGLQASGSW
jgi:membrane-associated phospholipid phosphatase